MLPRFVSICSLALGTFNLPEADARAGSSTFRAGNHRGGYCNDAGDYETRNYIVTLSSEDGVAMGPVAEPSTVALFAAGLMGIGGLARRRRSIAAA